MPEICRFYGIVVAMFYNDHNPPHLHARFGEYKVCIRIETGDIISGEFPDHQIKMLREWLSERRLDCMLDWQRAKDHLPLFPIEPLS